MATALKNLSKRANALQAQYLERQMRVNVTTELGAFPLATSDRAVATVRGNTKFTPRERAANEAMPRDATGWTKDKYYRTGDGETQLTRRVGSDDHLRYKSFGFGT